MREAREMDPWATGTAGRFNRRNLLSITAGATVISGSDGAAGNLPVDPATRSPSLNETERSG
jgi:hypothetical protein